MSKKKKLTNINRINLGKILEIKAILEALSDIEQTCYPANILIEIARKKVVKVFKNIEKTRSILKIID